MPIKKSDLYSSLWASCDELRLDVTVTAYFLQRMKTKAGSCNIHARHIRLNTELVKKPRELLEYVVVHEMLHLRVPTHSERFVALMSGGDD